MRLTVSRWAHPQLQLLFLVSTVKPMPSVRRKKLWKPAARRGQTNHSYCLTKKRKNSLYNTISVSSRKSSRHKQTHEIAISHLQQKIRNSITQTIQAARHLGILIYELLKWNMCILNIKMNLRSIPYLIIQILFSDQILQIYEEQFSQIILDTILFSSVHLSESMTPNKGNINNQY